MVTTGAQCVQYEAFTHGSREPGPGGGRFRFKVTTTAVMSLIGLLSKVVHASATLLKERLFFGLLSKFNDEGVRTRTDSVCGFLSFFCPLDVSDSSVPGQKKESFCPISSWLGVGGALAWGVLIVSCTANSNFVSEFSETLRTPLPRPLAVVEWYRIYANWYKPDLPALGQR